MLVVDDFGIQYVYDDDLQHLLNALKDRYTIFLDSSGSNYYGLTLNWDYNVKVWKVQYEMDADPLPILSKQETTKIQQIVGSLLYCARAVDPTLLVALGSITSDQNKPTATTAAANTQILNYVATHPLAVIKYTASQMILHVHSDASYLSEKKQEAVQVDIFSFAHTNLFLPMAQFTQ